VYPARSFISGLPASLWLLRLIPCSLCKPAALSAQRQRPSPKTGQCTILPVTPMASFVRQFRKALWLALEHDVLNTAKAAAYSGCDALSGAGGTDALLAQVPEGTRCVARCGASSNFCQRLHSLLKAALEIAAPLRAVDLLRRCTRGFCRLG